ncbi:Gfo/Idh/MocA family protein [Cellulosimicrobium arenosum]|uniref:Gfo/Idh/MocA family oxidoreductase n=1 Tax=Cellulosimicrobium arenosum TaxID=2708133 RepID=A0A927GB09_9MICO|nr:Gfo/Idh/MocA family oxidoreductase [Cellulosimicrobium arenosum]MBD8079392.1 Gfo/Idh/MocA family oxidoreductase [Cellulosimicrobium arenosum]
MSTDRLGVGVVGMGGIATMHARALRELGERVRLVAYSGGAGPAREEALAGWPAAHLAPQEVISHPEVDVVAVCSPSGTHAELALAALEAGRHVVVEKPLALDVGDALRVAEAARERGLMVSTISQRRFEPEHVALKRAVDTGALGEVRLATTHVHWFRDDDYYRAAGWRSTTAQGGGSLMNQGVHNLDLLRWLCGPVDSVTAQHGTLGHAMEAEDTTVATVRFTSGALGVVTTTTTTPPGFPATITLLGARGAVELGQGDVLRWDVPGVPAPGSGAIASGAADPLAIGHAGHLAQWRQIVTALDSASPVPVGIDDAVETVRLLCAIYAAAETGATVRPSELATPSRQIQDRSLRTIAE